MTMQENLELPTASSTKPRRRQKKTAVFELLNNHAVREFRMIDKFKLSVPVADYQRDESHGRISAEIAMHFDIVSFGCLLIIQRADGSLVVADGGTRLSAALKRADISDLPCIVYSGLTDTQEGDVFLRVNCNRRKLQIEQLHHAQLFTKDELAVYAQKQLDRLLAVRVEYNSLGTIRRLLATNAQAVTTIIDILVQVAPDKHVSARILIAMSRLEVLLNKQDKTLNQRSTLKRVHEKFGSFDAVVNAMVKPKSRGDSSLMAHAIARTLHIRLGQET